MNKPVKIALIVVALIAAAAAALYFSSVVGYASDAEVETVVQGFVEAVEGGDPDAAYAYLADAFQAELTQTQFVYAINPFVFAGMDSLEKESIEKGRLKAEEANAEALEGAKGYEYEGIVVFANGGGTADLKVGLVEENEELKIFRFSVQPDSTRLQALGALGEILLGAQGVEAAQ